MSKWTTEEKNAAIVRYKAKMKKSKRAMKNPINSDLKHKMFAMIREMLRNEKRWHWGICIHEMLIETDVEMAKLNEVNGKAFRLGTLHQIFKYIRENNLVEYKKIGGQTFYKYSEKLETLK